MTRNILKKNNLLKLIIPMLCLIGVLYAGIIYINADTTGYDPVSNKYNGNECVSSTNLGEVTEYYFEADSSILVLKSNIDTTPDSRATFEAEYNGNTAIKKVIIAGDLYFNNSNPNIGIFTNCTNLESVDFSTYGSFSTNIVNDTFNGCSKLISVDLTNFYLINSVTTIRSMFSGCSQIEEINLGTHFDTSNIESMWALFNGCTNLKSVDLGTNFTLKGITTNEGISDIFGGCTSLSKVKVGNLKANEDNTNTYKSDKTLFTTIIPKTITELDLSTGYNTEDLTDFNNMFASYTSLTKLDLGNNFDTSSATQMNRTFYQCKAPEINLGSKFDTSNVNNSMSEMFRECSNLTSLDLGDKFDTSNVASTMWAMFYGCTNLQTLDLGNNFSVDKAWSYSGTLSELIGDCSNLKTIKVGVKNPVDGDLKLFTDIIPSGIVVLDLRNGFNTTTLTTMDDMFDRFTSLTELYLGDQFTPITGCKINELFSGYIGGDTTKPRLNNLEILDLGKNFNTTGFTDMSNMFYNHPHLQVLNFGDKFDTSSVTNMSQMFASIGLSSLTLPATFDTSNVTDMESMFNNCNALEEIKLGSNFNTSNVTTMYRMFNLCNSLPSLTLPSTFNTGNVTTMAQMFHSNQSLKELDLGPNFDTSNVTNMEGLFYDCKSLTELDLGDKFDTSNCTNTSYMFCNMQNLTSLDLGDKFNTHNVVNMVSMFNALNKIQELDLGDKFNTSSCQSFQNMFSSCFKLKKLDLGDKFDTSKASCTGYNEGLQNMFAYCNDLKELKLGNKIVIPENVKAGAMFDHLENLTTLDLSNVTITENSLPNSFGSDESGFAKNSKIDNLILGTKITSFGKNSSGPLTKKLFLTGTTDIKPMNLYLTYADGDTDPAHLEALKTLVTSYDWSNDNRQIINIPTLWEPYYFEYAPGTYNQVTALADLNVYYYDLATSKYVKVPNSELTYAWKKGNDDTTIEASNTLTLENKEENTGAYTCEVSYGESTYTMIKYIYFLPSNGKFIDANELEDKVYTGSKVDINLEVIEKGTETVLTKGTDYNLFYGTEKDMYNLTFYREGDDDTEIEKYLTNAGEKTIWIQGTGSIGSRYYYGTIPRSFKILPRIEYKEDAEIKDHEELIQKVHATLATSDALDIPAGNEIEFQVTTEESILDPVDEKAIDNKAKKNDNIKKIGSYDINIECSVDGSPVDLSIKENKKIKLQLTIPVDKNANLDYKTLKVYHLLSTNGNIEELNVSNIDETNNLVSFNIETGSFSNFILYASKKANNNNDTPGGNIPSNITTQTITVAIIDHKKVIEGYEDKTFKPNNNITLQEVAALLARTSTDYNDKVDYTTYLENANIKDVPNSLWGKNYLGYMVLNGFMEKDSKGNLNPQKNATREEVVKIICKYKNLDVTNKTTTLIDVNNETANYAGALEELGFIEGYADKSFKGDKNITRAEFAKLLCKLLNREITNPNRITNSMKNELKIYLSDLNENSWYYPYIFELSYDHSKQFLHNN